jgi:hypothetical protein
MGETAVEWIEDKIQSDMTFIEILGLIRQAKEMEKQQIINCYNQSWHFRDKPYETAEKYYNETLGGKDII